MKKLLIFLTVIILITSINITPSAQTIGTEKNSRPLHYMGALPDSKAIIEKYLMKEDTSKTVLLPSNVDNSYLYPTPMEQTQPDCVAWAIGYAQMAGMQALNRDWTVNTNPHKFSPAFLYNLSNGGNNNGILLGDGMVTAVENGICPITYYSIDNPYNASVPSLALAAASLYKPVSYSITASLSHIKQALADGKGVAIGVWVYEEMYYNMSTTNYIYDDDSGDLEGGHAICLVGYDDSKQAFKFINSWGADWCQGGFGWISYDLVASDNVNMYGACRGYVMNFSEDNYIMGDANLDNTLNASDGRLALRFSNGLETPTDRQYVLSDVDGDGELTQTDAINILNYTSQNINKLPIYE